MRGYIKCSISVSRNEKRTSEPKNLKFEKIIVAVIQIGRSEVKGQRSAGFLHRLIKIPRKETRLNIMKAVRTRYWKSSSFILSQPMSPKIGAVAGRGKLSRNESTRFNNECML